MPGSGSVTSPLAPVTGSVPGSCSSALPGSLLGLTAAGSLALGGLEVLGARVYDAGVRGFLSVDPVAAPVGAGWASNAISEDRSEVSWDGEGIKFLKGAASSALTSDPLKSVGFERPLRTMAGDTSAGQRVAVAGVSGVAVSVNGVAVEEISDDKQ